MNIVASNNINVKYNNKKTAKKFKNIFDAKINSASDVVSSLRLKDIAPVNADILNSRKSNNIELSKHFYEKSKKTSNTALKESIKKRANRIFGCCYNTFSFVANERSYNIHTHRCRDRHCPDCQRVRSYIWQSDIEAIMPELIKERDNDGWLLVTLTVNNPLIENLSDTIRAINIAFKKMYQIVFEKFSVGGVKVVEITRGRIEGRCHPHIHALIQVRNSYFKHHYISKNNLADLWLKYVSKELSKFNLYNCEDYENGIVVDIARVLTGDGYDKLKELKKKKYLSDEDYLTSDNIMKKGNGQKVINYILKYSTKESKIFNGDEWSFIYDVQIKGQRLVSSFGEYKHKLAERRKEKRLSYYNEEKFLAELKGRADIDEIKDEQVFNNTFNVEYFSKRSTLEEALESKRNKLVEGIRKTGLIQSQVAFIGHTTHKDLENKIKLFDDTPSHKNLEALNEVISDLNLSKKNKRALHQRLVDAGHRVMVNEYQYYIRNDERVIYDIFDFAFDTDLIDVNDVYLKYDNTHNLEIVDSFSQLPF